MLYNASELVTQSCPTLCDPIDCSPTGSSVHEILQARILEWVAIPFSRGSSHPKDWTQVSRIAGGFFTSWATRKLSILVIIFVVFFLFFIFCGFFWLFGWLVGIGMEIGFCFFFLYIFFIFCFIFRACIFFRKHFWYWGAFYGMSWYWQYFFFLMIHKIMMLFMTDNENQY